MLRISLVLSLLFITSNSMALSSFDHYYGTPSNVLEATRDLKNELHIVLDSFHYPKEENYDSIDSFCESDNENTCYSHRRLSYRQAREYLFGQLHLKQSKNGKFWVRTTYCDQVISNDQLPPGAALGHFKIPHSETLNTEHSWPQSLFTTKYPKSIQKSDLHALFPVLSKVNSTRGNKAFGKVIEETSNTCAQARFGKNRKNHTVFEPADSAKGNVARAIFYFSTRYELSIDPIQESTLRQWHQMDPVDFDELVRHEEIYEIQHVRNPYIDHPEWVDFVKNF